MKAFDRGYGTSTLYRRSNRCQQVGAAWFESGSTGSVGGAHGPNLDPSRKEPRPLLVLPRVVLGEEEERPWPCPYPCVAFVAILAYGNTRSATV